MDAEECFSAEHLPHVTTPAKYWTLDNPMEDATRAEVGSAGDEVTELRKICVACENALLNLLDLETYTQTREPRTSHHEGLSSLAASSGIGCWICAAVQDELGKYNWNGRAHCGTYFEAQLIPEESEKHRFSKVYVRRGQIYDPVAESVRYLIMIYIEQDEHDSLEIVSGRQLTGTPNLAWASTRIGECAQTRRECAARERERLPTRVIDVGIEGESEPKLLETGNLFGAYVALSHCWGNEDQGHQRTTMQNKDKRINAIPFRDLPQTFKDAIVVTRSLRYQYLWIDLFCIVQDDGQDWARECGSMARVFSKAAVVLAASCASGPEDGFLYARPRSCTESGDSASLGCGQIKAGPHLLGVEIFDDFYSSLQPHWKRTGHDALSTRAWAYQEKVLSTRILSFHQGQLVFECCNSSWYERRPDLTNLHWNTSVVQKRQYSSPQLRDWQKAVENFTARSITYGNDVLPALAGVASQYQSLTGYTFTAGLWRETFLEDLGWITSSHGSSNATYTSTSWSPSWSWASCPGPVRFPWEHLGRREGAAEVLDVVAVPENGENPFGAVSAAKVTLRGSCRRARCHWTCDKFYLAEAGSNRIRLGAGFHPDSCEPKYRSSEDAIEVVFLQLWEQPSYLLTIALMLKPLHATSTLYRRIGLIQSNMALGAEHGVEVHLVDWLRVGEENAVQIV